MAAPKAPVLDLSGKKAKDVTLVEAVFAAEVKPHLVHEAVRAESAAARAGTHAAKSRGLVSGGRSKPWRQKGTGRARAGSTRAPQWTGGGVAFAKQPRGFDLKVNRKARRSAFRSALSFHAEKGSIAAIDAGGFGEPSTKSAAELVRAWDPKYPLLVVALPEEENVIKSFRNLDRALVLEPSELEVGALVWARAVLATEGALEQVQEAMSK
jgi:large subunit ribosomal protein L4